jgi:hypothetical protein
MRGAKCRPSRSLRVPPPYSKTSPCTKTISFKPEEEQAPVQVSSALTCRHTSAAKYMLATRLNWWYRLTGMKLSRLYLEVTSSLLAKAPSGRRLQGGAGV